MLTGDNRIDPRILNSARSLSQAGCNVAILAGHAPALEPNQEQIDFPELEIIRVLPEIPESPLHHAQVDFDILERVKKSFPLFDWEWIIHKYENFILKAIQIPSHIYVAHDLPMLPFASVAAAYHGSYLMYDAHEIFAEQEHYPDFYARFFQMVETLYCPLADAVTVVSQSQAEAMEALYNIDRPEVILNAAAWDPNALPKVREKIIHQKLGLPLEKKLLLYQGNLSRYRNLDTIINAMKLIKNEDVVFALMGYDSGFRSDLYELARRTGLLNNKVFFVDPVPNRELFPHTASADAGICPYPPRDINVFVHAPNKLFEYIVAGIPIIGNNTQELNRFIRDQGIGITHEFKDAESVAYAIDTFFSGDVAGHTKRVRELSDQYTWEKQGEKLVQIYDTLLAQPRPHDALWDVKLAELDCRRGDYACAAQRLAQIEL